MFAKQKEGSLGGNLKEPFTYSFSSFLSCTCYMLAWHVPAAGVHLCPKWKHAKPSRGLWSSQERPGVQEGCSPFPTWIGLCLALMGSSWIGEDNRVFLSFFLKNVYLFLRERDTEHEQGRGREREGDTESEGGPGLRAVSTEPDVGLELTNLEIMT